MGYWYQDSVNSSFSHKGTYSYDGVNRLSSAVATGNSTYNLAFTYDRYGNMACSQNSNTNGPCPEWTYNTSSNQLTTSGFTYDAAGNLTKDSSNATAHTYQWDAEGRVTSVDPGNNPPTWAFTYNALGQRVQWVSPSGTYEHMFDPSGAWLGIYGVLDVLRWGNGAYAWYNGSETYFNHINNISSTSVMTNHAGTTVEDVLFYPWGDVWESWGNGGYNFAELPYYDPTTNTSPTLNRFYSMNVGRWLSPDPVPGDPTNPQTWNRYAYALNNPTTLIDPLGLDPEDAGNGCTWDPDTNTLNCPPPPGPPTIGCANMDGYGCGYNGPNTANWGSPTYPGDGSGGSGGSGNGANNGSQSQTSACTVTNGRTTAPSPEQMNRLGAGPFGVPPVGSVAIDPWALGLLPGKQTNALLGPNASQITFSFSPVPNLPQGFPTTMTLGSIVGPASVRAGGSQFNGLYVFDIFGLPSLAAANAATSPPGAPVGVTVTYPSSLPVNCGGPLSDTPPVPPPPTAPVPAFRRHF
jgi:RHS repeat-associated protein